MVRASFMAAAPYARAPDGSLVRVDPAYAVENDFGEWRVARER